MNDSVKAIMMALKSVIDYLGEKGQDLHDLDDQEAVLALAPFAEEIGTYLASLSEDERKRYRGLRGVQGQTTRLRRFQQHLAKKWPDFDPPGLSKFLAEEEKETNSRSHKIITDIEVLLQSNIVSLLKGEYGAEISEWWVTGVPDKCRKPAVAMADSDGYKRGGLENYLNLIDYRDISRQSSNWALLSPIFALGSPNANKDERTKWLVTVNEVRKVVMHASSGQTVSVEQLDELEAIYGELRRRLSSPDIGNLP